MNGLALCAGIGGLELGLHLTLNTYRTVCYVENDKSCQEFLIQRFGNGLDEAPIWDELSTFDGSAWRGKVDIISAGYPCQPFSSAGKRKGMDDPRYLWPQLDRIIGEVSPSIVFLENVRKSAYEEALPALMGRGYDIKTTTCSSAQVGGAHLRRRAFVLAYVNKEQLRFQPGWSKGANGNQKGKSQKTSTNTNGEGKLQPKGVLKEERRWTGYSNWRTTEPQVARMVHGFPNRVAQERALGNAVDPWVAAKAFTLLTE